MKPILKYDVVKLICSFSLVWLVFGFVALEFNPLAWSGEARYFLIHFGLTAFGAWKMWK